MEIKKDDTTGLYWVEVDGHRYDFVKWGASHSLKILTRLAHIVAEPMGIVLGGVAAGSKGELQKLLDMDFNPEMVSAAVRALMTNCDEATTDYLVKQFAAEHVLCEGAKIHFDTHYQDRLDHLFNVVRAGVEVQYGNFFGALRGRLGAIAPKPKATVSNRAQPTSTGRSGPR